MTTVLLALALVLPPAPTARVNDYMGLLSGADRRRLEALLAERERETGAQVVVAIFPSLDGESLEEYSIRLAERWRVGRKDLDDGVILLVFYAERRVRLEIGYGLEAAIPDAEAARIVREVVAPQFRAGHFAAGLDAAVSAVYDRIPARVGGPGRARGPDMAPIAALVFVAVIAGFVVMSQLGSARRIARRRGYTAGYRGWYTPTDVYRGGWGWGRGGWSGRSGGGGFSGGGGSFGGGGASGSW